MLLKGEGKLFLSCKLYTFFVLYLSASYREEEFIDP